MATFLFEKVCMLLNCGRRKFSNSFSSRRCNTVILAGMKHVIGYCCSRPREQTPFPAWREKASSLIGSLPLLRVILRAIFTRKAFRHCQAWVYSNCNHLSSIDSAFTLNTASSRLFHRVSFLLFKAPELARWMWWRARSREQSETRAQRTKL